MAKTDVQAVNDSVKKEKTTQNTKVDALQLQLVLTGADIVAIGTEAEIIVGGKNYNTALISQVENIRAPQFRAISSICFHKVLDETSVNAALVRQIVEKEYNVIDWEESEVNEDTDFIRKLVRNLAVKVQTEKVNQAGSEIPLRLFINNVVDGFATSPEGIDQLRKRSVLVQTAILSVVMPKDVQEAVRVAYLAICQDAGLENEPVAVRSSAAGEDSCKKAFAGLQDTYLNIRGEERCIEAYLWDCASAYNLRSMTYRREAILDAVTLAEETGDVTIAEEAKKEWAIENTSLSVCIMRMINPLISGTAFSADTATGCRGTDKNDLVSIDASYGLGESVVGGMVTPDKFYVFQRTDHDEVVIRFMGCKDMKIIYDEDLGGTKDVDVPANEVYRWSLSIAQAEEVARGVRSISKAYGGMIMDSEFCFDALDRLWFVQARPETRWNEELELHPDTIYMRRREVDPKAIASAKVILEGNGASRGAGQGTVRFLRSALELNKINKGDILAADRTDPDMVPGMRVASAILADVGGDTSHAAITSRELGIPAIIGIQRLEALRMLNGQEITVDGSTGRVYRGLLPLVEVGGELNTATIPETRTNVGLVLADVGQSLFLSRLRQIPDFEVGLLRAEFMLGNIGVHPLALEAYDKGTLDGLVNEKLVSLENELSKVMQEQLEAGLIFLPVNVRDYVGVITGITEKMQKLAASDTGGATDASLAVQRKLRELDKKLDKFIEHATERLDIIKSSPFLWEHVAVIFGYKELLETRPLDKGELKNYDEKKQEVDAVVKAVETDEIVKNYMESIFLIREEVSLKKGLEGEMEELRTLSERIRTLIISRGYRTGKENYIQILSQGLALFAMAFHGKDVLYRTTDFKSNEYRNLLGGQLFEAFEDNPMLGYRGVSRNIHDWELESFKLARGIFGGKNLHMMFPFVRTIEELRSMKRYLKNVHNLESGKDGLKVFVMSEIPSNAILCKEFIKEVDGFSIGSNDMTQMVLATDRDNASLQHIYDEEDPAVVWAILTTIFCGQKYAKKVGFCGQGVSNSDILRGLVSIAGIVTASVVPDTYLQTKLDIAEIEKKNIPVSGLGTWLKEVHFERIKNLLEQNGYVHIVKRYNTVKDLFEWYEAELDRFAEQLRDNIETAKEDFYRHELESFRLLFHKQMIYANWEWDQTVEDALHLAGFSSFAEQEEAYKVQCAKKK